MAWTDPINSNAGDNVIASWMNTYVRDNQKDLWLIPVRQTATITKNANTTFADLTGLTFSVSSGEVWAFRAMSFFLTSAAADAKWTVTAPAASTGRIGLMGSGIPITAQHSTTFGSALDMACGALTEAVVIHGHVTAGANGSVTIQAAQNTSTAFNTLFYINSLMFAHRMSA